MLQRLYHISLASFGCLGCYLGRLEHISITLKSPSVSCAGRMKPDSDTWLCIAIKLTNFGNSPSFVHLRGFTPFTMCTGIPCRTHAWFPWESPNQQQPSVHIPGRAIFFTDGSASPPEYAGVRISTWSVVHAKADSTFHKVSAGSTPGFVHTIARAETYAVLQAIRSSPACDIYVDNQGVFLNLNRICSDGYKPLDWKNQVNGDLWRQISQAVLTKPQGSIQVTKVKSHRNPGDAKDPKDLWTILGNDHADKVAKDEMCIQTRDNQWSTTRHKDYDQYIKDLVVFRIPSRNF